jgi:hypothetical protein
MTKWLISTALVFLPATAMAQFNKCTDKDGKVVYMDSKCPSGTKADERIKADDAVAIPELTWDKQTFAHHCADRWKIEVSPQARFAIATRLRSDAEAGRDKSFDAPRNSGLTREQAIARFIDEEFVQTFNSDCLYFGFRRVSAETDSYNERASRELKRVLDTKYSGSRERYERTRRW